MGAYLEGKAKDYLFLYMGWTNPKVIHIYSFFIFDKKKRSYFTSVLLTIICNLTIKWLSWSGTCS